MKRQLIKNKIQEKGGEKRMKRLTAMILVLGLTLAPLLAPQAQALYDWTNIQTLIERSWNSLAQQLSQMVTSVTQGFTTIQGQNYEYNISNITNFGMFSYVAKAISSYTKEIQNGLGEAFEIIETFATFFYDDAGRSLGATGTRTRNGQTEEMDLADNEIQGNATDGYYFTDNNGNIVNITLQSGDDGVPGTADDYFTRDDTGARLALLWGSDDNGTPDNPLDDTKIMTHVSDGIIQSGEGVQYFSAQDVLSYANFNGGTEVVGITSRTQYFQDAERTILLSTTESNTINELADLGGVTEVVKSITDAKTTFENQGTLDVDVNGNGTIEDNERTKPYTISHRVDIFAFDDDHNKLGSAGLRLVRIADNPATEDIDETGIEIYDANDQKITLEEALAIIDGSYSVETSSGVTQGRSGWVFFNQTGFTTNMVENGVLLPHLTYQKYSNGSATENLAALTRVVAANAGDTSRQALIRTAVALINTNMAGGLTQDQDPNTQRHGYTVLGGDRGKGWILEVNLGADGSVVGYSLKKGNNVINLPGANRLTGSKANGWKDVGDYAGGDVWAKITTDGSDVKITVDFYTGFGTPSASNSNRVDSVLKISVANLNALFADAG